jgi:hypothetical protein
MGLTGWTGLLEKPSWHDLFRSRFVGDAVSRNRNSTALRPVWEFAVHSGGTVKSILALV